MTHGIELRHLQYFVSVAEELNFTRAASRLRIAQPSLSTQIRQLEERVGAVLLNRRPRMALTNAGVAFLSAARRVLRHSQQAIDLARKVGAGSRAVVHVGLASSVALTEVPACIRQFKAVNPRVEVRIVEMHSAEQMDALRAGIVDIGISREATTEPGFVVRELIREPFLLMLSARHPTARRGDPVAVRHLAHEPFVLFPRSAAPMLRDQIDAMCRQAGFRPRVDTEAREWHTIAALVAAGFGISVAPASVARLNIDGVAVRPLRRSPRAVTLLVYSRDPTSAAVPALAGFIAGAVRKR